MNCLESTVLLGSRSRSSDERLDEVREHCIECEECKKLSRDAVILELGCAAVELSKVSLVKLSDSVCRAILWHILLCEHCHEKFGYDQQLHNFLCP